MADINRSNRSRPVRSQRQWTLRYQSSLTDALEHWSADPVIAASSEAVLAGELAELADPGVVWSDPDVVERLVRVAAQVEALSMLQPAPVAEAPAVGAALATSLFAVYLRENGGVDCVPYLSTLPRRITEASLQLGSMPEEAANELAFSASMAIAALR